MGNDDVIRQSLSFLEPELADQIVEFSLINTFLFGSVLI